MKGLLVLSRFHAHTPCDDARCCRSSFPYGTNSNRDERKWSGLISVQIRTMKGMSGKYSILLLLLQRSEGLSPISIHSQGILTSPSRQSRPYVSSFPLASKPKRGAVVDSYQTVSVKCEKCRNQLFRYKKKNGTKSNLIKCFVERIVEDPHEILSSSEDSDQYHCPHCETTFARSAIIRGMPALKLVGGKTRMSKK